MNKTVGFTKNRFQIRICFIQLVLFKFPVIIHALSCPLSKRGIRPGDFTMRKTQIRVISLIAVLFLIAIACTVYADTGVPAVPEIQGISSSTLANAVGTVTESDSTAWTTTNDPFTLYSYSWVLGPGYPVAGLPPGATAQLQSAGGSLVLDSTGTYITQFNVPQSLLSTQMPLGGPTWSEFLSVFGPALSSPVVKNPGIHTGTLDPGQVQYTAGYNDQYSGVSGQQTFAKSLAISTGNTIADQSNIKANTNIQYVAVDTGRATRTEDLLLDGASQAQNSSGLILCPFANANPGVIPAFCNIVQAGSSLDTTLTSTVTSADTRFVGTDATIPVVLDYTINAEGISLGSQSSPMIGSVSAYLKVHVQESRNESSVSSSLGAITFMYPDPLDSQKSEDLTHSELSTASGLINQFSKSVSYTSQASAVQAPPRSPKLPN